MMIETQKQGEEKIKRIEDAKKKANKQHLQDVQNQISSIAEQKALQRKDFLEEGRKVRQKLADDILKLETIKKNKLQQMEAAGLGDYAHDLMKHKVHNDKIVQ